MEYSEWDNIGRKKEWSPDATWMNLGNIIPSERSQSQKTMYYMIPRLRNVQNRKIRGT